MTDLLTTPSRVRNRLGFADITLTDQILLEYIIDAQSYIEQFTRRTFRQGVDLDFQLASSVCTDLATVYAIIRPIGGSAEGVDFRIDEFALKTSTQLEKKLSTANQYLILARQGLNTLKTEQADLPFTSDQVGL